jgi:hypothetical protein
MVPRDCTRSSCLPMGFNWIDPISWAKLVVYLRVNRAYARAVRGRGEGVPQMAPFEPAGRRRVRLH